MMDDEQRRINAEIIAQTAKATALAVQEAARAAADVLDHSNNIALTEIAVLRTDFMAFKSQYVGFEMAFNRKMDSLDTKFDSFIKELRLIAEGRPTWPVTWLLSALVSLCVGLLTLIGTHHY